MQGLFLSRVERGHSGREQSGVGVFGSPDGHSFQHQLLKLLLILYHDIAWAFEIALHVDCAGLVANNLAVLNNESMIEEDFEPAPFGIGDFVTP